MGQVVITLARRKKGVRMKEDNVKEGSCCLIRHASRNGNISLLIFNDNEGVGQGEQEGREKSIRERWVKMGLPR